MSLRQAQVATGGGQRPALGWTLARSPHAGTPPIPAACGSGPASSAARPSAGVAGVPCSPATSCGGDLGMAVPCWGWPGSRFSSRRAGEQPAGGMVPLRQHPPRGRQPGVPELVLGGRVSPGPTGGPLLSSLRQAVGGGGRRRARIAVPAEAGACAEQADLIEAEAEPECCSTSF